MVRGRRAPFPRNSILERTQGTTDLLRRLNLFPFFSPPETIKNTFFLSFSSHHNLSPSFYSILGAFSRLVVRGPQRNSPQPPRSTTPVLLPFPSELRTTTETTQSVISTSDMGFLLSPGKTLKSSRHHPTLRRSRSRLDPLSLRGEGGRTSVARDGTRGGSALSRPRSQSRSRSKVPEKNPSSFAE